MVSFVAGYLFFCLLFMFGMMLKNLIAPSAPVDMRKFHAGTRAFVGFIFLMWGFLMVLSVGYLASH